jgi:hypothetical protein
MIVGWDRNYNQDYLKYNLSLTINPDLKVLIGSGHFVDLKKRYFRKYSELYRLQNGRRQRRLSG